MTLQQRETVPPMLADCGSITLEQSSGNRRIRRRPSLSRCLFTPRATARLEMNFFMSGRKNALLK